MSWFWFSNQKNELKLTDFLAKETSWKLKSMDFLAKKTSWNLLIIWLGKQAEISWFSSQEIKLRLADFLVKKTNRNELISILENKLKWVDYLNSKENDLKSIDFFHK